MEQSRTSPSITIPAATRSTIAPKWRALRAIAFLLKILAWLALIGGLVAAALVIAMGSHTPVAIANLIITGIPGSVIGSLFVALPVFVGALVTFLVLYALSELILLLISIERSLRNRY